MLQAKGFLEADDDDEESEESENSEEYFRGSDYDEDGGTMHSCGFDCCPQCAFKTTNVATIPLNTVERYLSHRLHKL